MEQLIEQHHGELTILILAGILLGTLLILVPQLLRSHQKKTELKNAENMLALEKGHAIPPVDIRAIFAGRTALLVPMVSVCTAGTVTCFLVANRSDTIFSVSLIAWTVAGVVSLAAITGGVALMGRLAQLQAGAEDEQTHSR